MAKTVQFQIITNSQNELVGILELDNDGRLWAARYSAPVLGQSNVSPWAEIIGPPPQPAPTGPDFVSIAFIASGNFLLGLKDDGTIWKSLNPTADPLVWTEVSG